MNQEHTCECGPRTGPMTRAQHDRIHHGMAVVDSWLASATSGNRDRMQRSLTAVQDYLLDAPTYHANVRQSGLVTYAARRCAAALPTKFEDFGARLSDPSGMAIDDTSPEHRIGIRLMVAYQRQDEVHARNLLLDYINDLPVEEITEHLHAVFLSLTEVYLWIHHQRRPRSASNGKHDLHVLATRATEAWKRLSAPRARR